MSRESRQGANDQRDRRGDVGTSGNSGQFARNTGAGQTGYWGVQKDRQQQRDGGRRYAQFEYYA